MSQLPQINSIRTPDPAVVRAGRTSRFPAINWPLLIIAAALVVYGLIVVYSAVSTDERFSFSGQLRGVLIGVVVMIVIWRFDYRRLSEFRTVFLVISVVLILSPHLPIIGVTRNGAASWIDVGMTLQPGELAKITVILLDASIMARYGGKLDDPMEYLKAVGLMLIPFVCILTQPDLGTGLVYLFIGAVALVMGGTRPKFLLITLGVLVGLVALAFAADEVLLSQTGEYHLLKEYQRNRLLVFLDQGGTDLSSEGYNLQQAKIAIGSGGLFGQGYMQGSQHALGILPEAPTDFIFCVLAEELGFMGALLLLGLYAGLILCGFRIAQASSDMFGLLAVMCIIGMWLFQILENIGMTCGLMPITGIPLPFMSYGSSFLVVNFALLGFMGSVWTHNKQNSRRSGYAAPR